MRVEINITQMCMGNGVLGLPSYAFKNWDMSKSYKGKLKYAGRVSDVTFTNKHDSARQFTVNDSVQFAQLKIDGVYTYAEGKTSGEKLICEMNLVDGVYELEVVDVYKMPPTNATNKLKELLMQGVRPVSQKSSKAPEWNEPSPWIDISELSNYKEITDCLYLWQGKQDGVETTYLYVGIVGDTKRAGKSKRTLVQRLHEEKKKYLNENNIHIKKFRFCSLNNPHEFSVPELLKTVEMAEITIMSSLFFCEKSHSNIDALFKEWDVVLLNKMTSYKFVK